MGGGVDACGIVSATLACERLIDTKGDLKIKHYLLLPNTYCILFSAAVAYSELKQTSNLLEFIPLI